MKIYISGPISNVPDGNFEAFKEAEKTITKKGHTAINPHTVCSRITGSWADYMRADIKAMMDADAILMLPDWDKSRGAALEMQLAMQLNIHIFFSPSGI
jgi:hypothetical protein